MRSICAVSVALLTGCSALHWGGGTTKQPGFSIRAGQIRVEATADIQARADELKLGEFQATNIEFGQKPSQVVAVEPAKLDAIARLQLTQVEYARVTWDGVRSVAAELLPVLKLLALTQFAQTEAGLTATLPGGVTIGTRALSGPAELQEFFRQAVGTVERLVPADPGPVPRAASQPVDGDQ